MLEVLTLAQLSAMDADDAAALLVYRRAEGATGVDSDLLEAWLGLAPEHLAAWRAASAAWSDFDGAEDEEILGALRSHAREAGPGRPRWAAPAAAAAVLLIGGALGFVLSRSDAPEGAPIVADVRRASPRTLTLENAGDGPTFHQLADGTEVVLDRASEATIVIDRTRRGVTLERGRAFFDVARDPARPFEIKAGDWDVRALGTKFEVRLRPGETAVWLQEGRVSVRKIGGQAAVVLEPGQQLVAQTGRQPQVFEIQGDKAADWRERYVDFDNVSLAQAALVLNRFGRERLVVSDPQIAGLRISGRFRTGDLPRFGRSLAVLHPVRLVRRDEATWEVVPAR